AHHGEGETREALPRPAIVILLALLAYWLLGGLFGGGGGGHGTEPAHEVGALATWGPRVMLVLGGVAGWLLAGSINAALNRFFAAFNRVFDRGTAAYGRGVG